MESMKYISNSIIICLGILAIYKALSYYSCNLLNSAKYFIIVNNLHCTIYRVYQIIRNVYITVILYKNITSLNLMIYTSPLYLTSESAVGSR